MAIFFRTNIKFRLFLKQSTEIVVNIFIKLNLFKGGLRHKRGLFSHKNLKTGCCQVKISFWPQVTTTATTAITTTTSARWGGSSDSPRHYHKLGNRIK